MGDEGAGVFVARYLEEHNNFPMAKMAALRQLSPTTLLVWHCGIPKIIKNQLK